MATELYDHQKKAIEQLKNGNILVGGVGSGKSLTSIGYYISKICKAELPNPKPVKSPKDLYIFTTARKRDEKDWEKECSNFKTFFKNVKVTIDSWNNISKYTSIKNSFVIFDEQRVVGSGVWVKSFLKIARTNDWVLLSATPGDTWMDYIPVFIANGFYKNRTQFINRHVVYSRYSKFPKVDRFLETGLLIKLRDSIIVNMVYKKETVSHVERITTPYDSELYKRVSESRWNVFKKKPIKNISELCSTIRRVVNEDPRRVEYVKMLMEKHPKVIVFYNFNYERKALLDLAEKNDICVAEWNGIKHEPIPKKDSWMYIVQYAAGAEGWNCIETDTIIFYSQNYSYKATIQAAGRIDRINTPFKDLYYYYLTSNSQIDKAIYKAFSNKRNFNESSFQSK